MLNRDTPASLVGFAALIRRLRSPLDRRQVRALFPGLVARWRLALPFPSSKRLRCPADRNLHMSPSRVVVINPLGVALAHYTTGLAATLASPSTEVTVEAVIEPGHAGRSKHVWLTQYVGTLLRTRHSLGKTGGRVIVTWPVIGHLDRVLIRVALGRHINASLVMHDPRPLVYARGYSPRSRRIGTLGGRVTLIVHSETAAAVLRHDAPEVCPKPLPHPLTPRAAPARGENARPVVRVLGQFKPDRDLTLLGELGASLAATHDLEIIGRGWPEVIGWHVEDAFVSEARLDELMATADAVLIPYRRFFQSGVAIRALELGTPAVGPAGSSMSQLYPDDTFLAGAACHQWQTAITAATSADRSDVHNLARLAQRDAYAQWQCWLAA